MMQRLRTSELFVGRSLTSDVQQETLICTCSCLEETPSRTASMSGKRLLQASLSPIDA